MSNAKLKLLEMLSSLEEDLKETENRDYFQSWVTSEITELWLRGENLYNLVSEGASENEAVIMRVIEAQKQIKNLWATAEEKDIASFNDIEEWFNSVLSTISRYKEKSELSGSSGPYEDLEDAKNKDIEWSKEAADYIIADTDLLRMSRELGLTSKSIVSKLSDIESLSKEQLEETIKKDELNPNLTYLISLNLDLSDPVEEVQSLIDQLINHPEMTQKSLATPLIIEAAKSHGMLKKAAEELIEKARDLPPQARIETIEKAQALLSQSQYADLVNMGRVAKENATSARTKKIENLAEPKTGIKKPVKPTPKNKESVKPTSKNVKSSDLTTNNKKSAELSSKSIVSKIIYSGITFVLSILAMVIFANQSVGVMIIGLLTAIVSGVIFFAYALLLAFRKLTKKPEEEPANLNSQKGAPIS